MNSHTLMWISIDEEPHTALHFNSEKTKRNGGNKFIYNTREHFSTAILCITCKYRSDSFIYDNKTFSITYFASEM